MKASMFLAATGAALAMAGPINKRAMETDWVYEIVTVTVTEGNEPGGVFAEEKTTASTTTTAPPPPPPQPTIVVPVEPETTQPPPPPPAKPSTKTRRPKPTKKPEPQPEPSPEPEPQPQPEPEPEPQPEPQPQQPGLDEYAKTVLEHHNMHRRNHSAPDLSWDKTLAGYAKNTAEGCVFEHDMDQGGGGYGQNLATYGSSGDLDSSRLSTAASGVTMQWYNGEFESWPYYGMDNPPEGADLLAWGHFTQVVWKSSEKLGCYTAKCPAGSVLQYPAWYTVCNYDPPGNYAGEYGANVLEPNGAKVQTVTV